MIANVSVFIDYYLLVRRGKSKVGFINVGDEFKRIEVSINMRRFV